MKHRHIATIAAFGILLAATGSAQTARWEIDPVHSNVSFTVRHMMLSNVRGEFTKFAGSVELNGTDPTTAKVSATIDAATINTHEPKRDADVRGPNFLDVAKFPSMTFVSRKVEIGAPGHFRLIGDLTIHGVTKEVTFEVDSISPPMKDPWGGTRVGAHATATINRKDFGLAWNKVLETGGVLVGDDVGISIDVELVKKA